MFKDLSISELETVVKLLGGKKATQEFIRTNIPYDHPLVKLSDCGKYLFSANAVGMFPFCGGQVEKILKKEDYRKFLTNAPMFCYPATIHELILKKCVASFLNEDLSCSTKLKYSEEFHRRYFFQEMRDVLLDSKMPDDIFCLSGVKRARIIHKKKPKIIIDNLPKKYWFNVVEFIALVVLLFRSSHKENEQPEDRIQWEEDYGKITTQRNENNYFYVSDKDGNLFLCILNLNGIIIHYAQSLKTLSKGVIFYPK